MALRPMGCLLTSAPAAIRGRRPRAMVSHGVADTAHRQASGARSPAAAIARWRQWRVTKIAGGVTLLW